jgi:pimeloyl-ACP methyl ester carboxylesterase
VKAFFRYVYFDSAPFVRDAAYVAEICNIYRTPNARQAWYWMQRALRFDFAIPDASRITSVSVPTLILWGREDQVVDVVTARRFHQDIARSQLVIIDDAGHMAHEEKPDAVNRSIVSFLDAIRR